ncbi:MAG: hypothetical protein K9H25_06015 [Rhodospirillum sp.]|nr:hypothetical protein [Rhodospirillum sp.]MCF8491402.1 hypothetical protein [Rhodospirillum sp.]MCF8501464.1 hypothetical protein [Rhodospirillum sp.]
MPEASPREDALPLSLDGVRESLRQSILLVCPNLTEDQLADSQRLTDLGVSSIEVMCIVFEIEEIHKIKIIDRGLDDFETLGEMALVVQRLRAERDRAGQVGA